MSHPPASSGYLNEIWAQNMVRRLVSLGIRHFFVAPGSRSAPLALAAASVPGTSIMTHFDERGLAFACLGYGRGRRLPGVFLCTSGTAVANAFPAVIEASLSRVPMLLLTADRPPELLASGANQTIHQAGIFGSYPAWQFEIPSPSDAIPLTFVRSTMEHAARQARFGPVHLNCAFREPLIGENEEQSLWDGCDGPVSSDEGDQEEPIPPFAVKGEMLPDRLTLDGDRIIVVAGEGDVALSRAARSLAQRLGAVFLADVTSQLHEHALEAGLWGDPGEPPTSVFHVGGRITSAHWWRFVRDAKPAMYCQVDRLEHRVDPLLVVTHRYCVAHAGQLDNIAVRSSANSTFVDRWRGRALKATEQIRTELGKIPELCEPAVAQAVGELVPSGEALFLGNSMPIRDADRFMLWPADRDIRVGANRGASGIDGLVASGVGFARGSQRPVTLIVGDLSLLHDLNSLALVKNCGRRIIVIAINNDGGGIFHRLPIAHREAQFERMFAMPQSIASFEMSATQFGLLYARPESMNQFRSTYSRLVSSHESCLLEVVCNRRHDCQFTADLLERTGRDCR